jgi:hypothetical protein
MQWKKLHVRSTSALPSYPREWTHDQATAKYIGYGRIEGALFVAALARWVCGVTYWQGVSTTQKFD